MGKENWFVMVNVPANNGQDWTMLEDFYRKVIIQKLNNLFQTCCHPSWSTFVRYRTVMYLWTGFSSKTYAEDTIEYIVGT